MELGDVFTVEPRWKRFRYLLSDGHVLDVRSPYNGDSNDRAEVLVHADRMFGVDKNRKIAGLTDIPDFDD